MNEWDGDKANNHFIQMYGRQNPDGYKYKLRDQHHLDLQDIELAIKDFYHLCARNAWTRERLLSALSNAMQIEVANKNANSEKRIS